MSEGEDRPVVLYCGSFEIPNGNASANRFEANAEILDTLGYEVIAVGFEKNPPGEIRLQEFSGYSAFLSPRPTGVFSWIVRSFFPIDVFRALRALKGKKIDFCILYDFPSVASLWVSLFGLILRFRVILEITEWYNKPAGWGPIPIYKSFDTWSRLQVLCRSPLRMIVASPFLKNRFQSKGDRILLLPSLHMVKSDTDEEASEQSVTEDSIRFLYAGRPFNVVDGKVDPASVKERLDKVISLLNEIRKERFSLRLDIVGVEKDTVFAFYPELAEADGEWLRFHGEVDHSAVQGMLRKTDFTIFLREESRHTLSGFPSKYSESIIHGVPVVTNHLANMEGFYSKEIAVIFPEFENVLEDKSMLMAKLTRESVEDMKEHCRRSVLFATKTYVASVAEFLES